MSLETITLVWPRQEELIGKNELTSEELLALKSVSFYAPIKMLELGRGQREGENKEKCVQTAYNILRLLDEAEDASKLLTVDDKKWIIEKFSFVIGEIVRKTNGSKGIEDIIKGSDFQSVTKKLKEGAADKTARVFVEQFGTGNVLRDLYGISTQPHGTEIQEAIHYAVETMATGMKVFLEKGPIETVDQLHTYCYRVAARIGSAFLNKLVEFKDRDIQGNPVILDDELAERFGEFLQLTNIIKNVRSDYKEDRRFFPREYRRRDVSYEYMMDGGGVDAEEAKEKMLEKMLSLAELNFKDSVKYVQSISEHISGYRAFCLIPLITAKKTLEHMRKEGAEKVFIGEKDAIKIPYGIQGIVDFSYGLVKNEEGKHTNEWLNEFAQKPEKFSFEPHEYEKWAGHYRGHHRVKIFSA